MMIAHMAGISVFATGGIGGVHRGAETTMDISADLEELAQTPVMVVCAGAKAILDLGLTLEYLETKGVPVLGYGTDELPAFYTRESGLGVDARVDTPEDLAAIFQAQRDLGLKTGMLVTNPIPQQYAMDKAVIDKAIDQALAESHEQGIHGKGDHAVSARARGGAHRRRQPREQHPARAQQRPRRSQDRCRPLQMKGGAWLVLAVSMLMGLGLTIGAIASRRQMRTAVVVVLCLVGIGIVLAGAALSIGIGIL